MICSTLCAYWYRLPTLLSQYLQLIRYFMHTLFSSVGLHLLLGWIIKYSFYTPPRCSSCKLKTTLSFMRLFLSRIILFAFSTTEWIWVNAIITSVDTIMLIINKLFELLSSVLHHTDFTIYDDRLSKPWTKNITNCFLWGSSKIKVRVIYRN